MTIYIPYKHNKEDALKYALRGIEKNFPHDVVLITDNPPEWFKGEILFKADPYPGVSGRRQFNIISKLFEVKDEKFFMWNDDHFLIKPINEIKNWYQGMLKEALRKAQGIYYEAVKCTLEHFGDVKYFDIHLPCVFTKEQIHRVFQLQWGSHDLVIKTSAFYNEQGEESTELKINEAISKEAIEHLTKDLTFFSTGNNGFKPQMISYLNELFPHKSKWEK